MAVVLIVLLILALASRSAASSGVTWNIDCGSTSNYTDINNIKWVGDNKNLVKAGKPRSVSPNSSLSDHLLDTLRVFTSKKGNCYILTAEKGVKVLLRVNFYYGDYDGKSSPPSFGLEIDGNDWITVQTSMEPGKYDYYEFIYITKGDSIDVCFLRTYPDQFPFVSSIRVQSIPFNMYPNLDPEHALFLQGRYAFGSDRSISYPDDAYDRIWTPGKIIGSGYSTVARSNTSSIDTSPTADKPPQATMANALTTWNTSARSMTLPPLHNIPSPSPLYINMYFTGVKGELSSAQKRSFNFLASNQPVDQSSNAITPTHGSAKELSIVYNDVVSLENTTLALVSTSDSSLPPLISAMEVFKIFDYTFTPPASPKKKKWKVILGVTIPVAFGFLAMFKCCSALGCIGDCLSGIFEAI